MEDAGEGEEVSLGMDLPANHLKNLITGQISPEDDTKILVESLQFVLRIIIQRYIIPTRIHLHLNSAQS